MSRRPRCKKRCKACAPSKRRRSLREPSADEVIRDGLITHTRKLPSNGVNKLSEWRVAMARDIKTNRIITPRIMTWAAVAWIAVWLTPYLYAVNDLITWR